MHSKDHPPAALVQALPELFDPRTWLPTVLAAGGMLRRQDVGGLVRSAADAIGAGTRQEAVSWIALGLRCHPDRLVDEIRRQGIFRCSKYRFHTGQLRPVVSTLLAHAKALSLADDVTHYLQSVSRLLQLGSSVRTLDASLREFLVRRNERALKTVVAVVDSLFMLDHQGDDSRSSENWKHYTKEDLAEAGSYIIHCFDAEIGLRDDHFNFMDEPGLIAGLYHKLLAKACKIRAFLAAEIFVDAFDYRCALRADVVRVEPPYPELEMSIRLGFIQNEQVSWSQRIERIIAVNQGQLSLYKAADLFYDRFRDRIVKLVEEPMKRYVFHYPDIPPFRAFFSEDGLLVEERLHLKEVLESELVTLEELKDFEIRKGITVLDLLKVYRLFGFVSHVTKRHLASVLEEEPVLAYRSLVPVFRIGQLERMLEWCLPKEAVRGAIDMLSWTPHASETVDLQYRPILRGHQYCLTPLNTAGAINWYRNLAYTQRRRVIDLAEEEAASRAVAATLSGASPHVRKGFGTTLKGRKIEIDVLARFGDYLFVFECKHSLLPCNPHELRTSYDHIKKAASQLTTIKELLAQKEVEAELYRRLGWALTPASEIITCIVSCNGMFPGLSIGGHPVRRWAELQNVIESGVVRVGSVRFTRRDGGIGIEADSIEADGLVEGSLWNGPELTPDFLRKYIKEALLRDSMFSAMVKVERAYQLGRWTLVFSSFGLDADAAQENVEKLLPQS